MVLTLGIVLAQAINIGTQHIPGYGWRISLMFAGVPALVLTLGGLLLPDTPNSLIERGHQEQGKQVLYLLILLLGSRAMRTQSTREAGARSFVILICAQTA